MNPDMTPYRMWLDVNVHVLPKKKILEEIQQTCNLNKIVVYIIYC